MESMEMANERLAADMTFKDSPSSIIKIRQQLKYVKLGCGYSCKPATIALFLLVLSLFTATLVQFTGVELNRFYDLWKTRSLQLQDDAATRMAGLVVLLLHLGLYRARRSRPVYLTDFECYKLKDVRKLSFETFLKMAEDNSAFDDDGLQFHKRISRRSCLGDEMYLPRGVTSRPPNLSMKEARSEAGAVLFGAIDALLSKTGAKPSDIGILIVNFS